MPITIALSGLSTTLTHMENGLPRVRCIPNQHERSSRHYTPPPSSLSLREEDDEGGAIWPPVEVRRCRFIDMAPPAALPPTLLVGDIDDAEKPLGIELVVEDRGRDEDAASLGREAPPLREAL